MLCSDEIAFRANISRCTKSLSPGSLYIILTIYRHLESCPTMPPSTVIDLVSSDDDKPLCESLISPSKTEFTSRDDDESLFLEDDFDETETARAPKRRKWIPSGLQIEDAGIYQQDYIDGKATSNKSTSLRRSRGITRLGTEGQFLDHDFDSSISLDDSWTATGFKKSNISPIRDVNQEESEANQLRRRSAQQGDVASRSSGSMRRQMSAQESDKLVLALQDCDSGHWRELSSATAAGHHGSDEDSFPEDIISRAVKTPSHPDLSERTVALLASLGGPTGKKPLGEGKGAKETCRRKTTRKNSSRSSEGRAIGAGDQEARSEAADKPKRVRKPKLTEEEKVARAKEKVAIALEREELKICKQEQKAKEKREKAEEKQKEAALAEVNKSKLDKRVTATDMIVDLPASINGQVVELQIKEFHARMQIDTTFYQSPVSNVIKWRRKVRSRYNAEKGHHEPLDQMEIENEKHVMCLLSAHEFASLASAGRDSPDIETHVLNLKINFPNCKAIYLIEGLTTWMRKNSTTLNRAYQAAVLSQMEPNSQAESNVAPVASRRSKKPADEHVDPDMIEDALLRLQVLHGCLVHHTAAPVETAEWVSTFTVHISTIPSRLERMNLDTSFCMESGQVKSGEDKQDTYVRMLQEVVRITAPIAYGIAAEYPTLVSLIEGMRQHGPLLLEDIEKCANKNGARSERKIGPSISKRLYKVLMGLDATSTDI